MNCSSRDPRIRGVAALVLTGVMVAFVAGCSTSSPKTGSPAAAAAFVSRVTTEFSRGQSGRLWDELIPADQKIVTRARFVTCQAGEGWALKSIKVLETYGDPVQLGSSTLKATAVSLQVTSDDGVTTATMHAVPDAGGWRWLLQPSDRAAYQAGKCPRTG